MVKQLTDSVYGEFTIDEPVLLELLEAPSFTRLQKLNQLGLPDRYYQIKPGYSRYTHSIGVLLLLRHLGASLEEQVAGLLHDISHTAFSHIADYLFGDPTKQDFQDNRHLEIINRSELRTILEKYGYNVERIAELEAFPLLDRPMPELCADRVDYCFREMDVALARRCFTALTVRDETIVFTDKALAYEFAKQYLDFQRTHWSGKEAVARYEVFTQTLQKALDRKIIDIKDLDTDDEAVIAKLEQSGDPEIVEVLERYKNASILEHYPEGSFPFRGKQRYVDPLYIEGDSLKRLSENAPEFQELLASEPKSDIS
jgi:HD superfamily phosphohydrolase